MARERPGTLEGQSVVPSFIVRDCNLFPIVMSNELCYGIKVNKAPLKYVETFQIQTGTKTATGFQAPRRAGVEPGIERVEGKQTKR